MYWDFFLDVRFFKHKYADSRISLELEPLCVMKVGCVESRNLLLVLDISYISGEGLFLLFYGFKGQWLFLPTFFSLLMWCWHIGVFKVLSFVCNDVGCTSLLCSCLFVMLSADNYVVRELFNVSLVWLGNIDLYFCVLVPRNTIPRWHIFPWHYISLWLSISTSKGSVSYSISSE